MLWYETLSMVYFQSLLSLTDLSPIWIWINIIESIISIRILLSTLFYDFVSKIICVTCNFYYWLNLFSFKLIYIFWDLEIRKFSNSLSLVAILLSMHCIMQKRLKNFLWIFMVKIKIFVKQSYVSSRILSEGQVYCI